MTLEQFKLSMLHRTRTYPDDMPSHQHAVRAMNAWRRWIGRNKMDARQPSARNKAADD